MKKILLHSPGVSTMNLGDQIICESAKEELNFVLNGNFVVEIPTHLPQSFYYMRHLKDSDYKFVLGSNLLKSTFFGFKRQWDIELIKSKFSGPVVLVGCGWWQYGNEPNLYTKLLLKSYLSKNYIHSVRDEYTKSVLNKIGFENVVNTSCPTMWSLNSEHCASIKKSKSSKVVFTLTDYNKDIESDRFLINVLFNNYEEVYFWPQGLEDDCYFRELGVKNSKLKVVSPDLEAYDTLLKSGDIDYIGTRLHGGIRALQRQARTLIIGIDNRANEKKKDFNLPVLPRENLHELEHVINSYIDTKISIPTEEIEKWKGQFSSELTNG